MADSTGKSSDSGSADKQPAKVQRDKLNANEGRVKNIVTHAKSYPQGKSGEAGNQQGGCDK